MLRSWAGHGVGRLDRQPSCLVFGGNLCAPSCTVSELKLCGL